MQTIIGIGHWAGFFLLLFFGMIAINLLFRGLAQLIIRVGRWLDELDHLERDEYRDEPFDPIARWR